VCIKKKAPLEKEYFMTLSTDGFGQKKAASTPA
jgi:hypothetical protein